MVHRRLYPWTACACWSCSDFARRPRSRFRSRSPATSPRTSIRPWTPTSIVTPVSSNPLNIGQSQWITTNGWVSGWSIQDIRTNYDATTDTLYVGVNTFKNAKGQYAPFGQANGDPTGTPTGYDPAHLGGDKSIALAIAPVNPTNLSQPGTPVVIAGVPADKTIAGTGTDGFTVSQFNASRATGGPGLPVRQEPAPEHGQPGLRSLVRPPAARVHDQELQQDPGPRSHDRILDLGLRRLEPRRRRRRSLSLLVEDPGQCRAEHPRADDLAGLDAGSGRGRLAAPQPEPGPRLRFGPSNQSASTHPCARRRPGPRSPSLFIGRIESRVFTFFPNSCPALHAPLTRGPESRDHQAYRVCLTVTTYGPLRLNPGTHTNVLPPTASAR